MSLPLWVVYQHPKDYPESFVARLWEIRDGEPGERMPRVVATESVVISKDLEVVREHMRIFGLGRLDRAGGDDPAIVEVWL